MTRHPRKQLAVKLAAVLLALTFVNVGPLAATPEASAEEHTLRFQSVAPARTPWARQLNRLKKSWEKASEGRLKVKVFLGRGNEIALVRKCKAGELQAIGVSTSALVDEVPEMGVFELPYLFSSYAQADKVIDDPAVFGMVDSVLKRSGFQVYIFSENGYRNFATKGKKIQKPSDLASLKMRVQENWIHESTYRALGGNPVRISVAEVLTSLSTGQVTGFDNTPLFAFATSWFSEIDTWTVSDHIYQPGIVVFNKKWFDGLPSDLQKILLADRAKETKKGRASVRKLTPKLLKKLEEKDITIYKMTDAEKSTFRAKTASVHAKFNTKGGKDGAKLLKLIKSKL